MDISELDELNTSESTEDLTPDPAGEVEDIVPAGEGEESGADNVDTDKPEGEVKGAVDTKDELADIDTSDTKLSGIESYLSKFDIEGGMISFDDGTQTHFNELDAEKQAEVLTNLHSSSATDIEDKYGLNEDEIGLINYLREKDTTLDEVIDQMASQRAETYLMSQKVEGMDVDAMSSDAVYTSFLVKSNPEATAEQLESDLVKAKEMSNYDNIVTRLRKDLVEERDSFKAQGLADEKKALTDEIEEQRTKVVDVVSKMDTVDGLSMNDSIKNEVLDMILNVDADGDSLFMTDVFSEPEKLFRAAFWYKNGADIISSREDFWKKEKSVAYKRGVEDSKSGRRTFVAADVQDKNTTTPYYGESDQIVSFDDLNR